MELYFKNEKIEEKYNFGKKLKDIFFNENNISDLFNNKYGRLLFNKLIKFITPEEKEFLMQKFKDKENILYILKELFSS